ncbi:MAG: polysaccharide biosynthesis/export family protein, partial [Acidobacteria bacterium]|nr:polysaccharide biosynthesis/export family protein [Acidobacteriota bacterium]
MKKNNVVSSLVIIVAVVCFAAAPLVSAQQIPPAAEKTASDSSVTTNTTSTAGAQVAPTTDGDDRYRIGPGDVLDIRILNRPNLSRGAVRVEGNGMIRMPLIETEIYAACKTEGELAKEIMTRYLKFYRHPQVDVFIKEYHSKQVAIIGAVNEQSRFELQRR